MFTSLPDSPQGVGDIVGIACRLVRNNIKLIFNFLLVPTIFTTLAGIAFQWILSYGVASIAETRSVASAFGLAGLGLFATVILALAWWILALRLLALVRLSLGFSSDLEDAKRNLGVKKWAVIGVYILCLLLMVAAMFAFGVAAFIIGAAAQRLTMILAPLAVTVVVFGMVIATSIYLLVSHVALSALACEEESAINVLGRSFGLVYRHFWRSFAFGLVFLITFTVISYPMSLPIAAISFADALTHGLSGANSAGIDGYKPPLWILVVAQTWESIMGMYLRPLLFFAFGLFYYDLRMRSEGLDIRRRLDLALPLEPVDVEH